MQQDFFHDSSFLKKLPSLNKRVLFFSLLTTHTFVVITTHYYIYTLNTTKEVRSVAIKENSRGKIIVDGYTLTHKQTIFCEEYVASNHDAYKAAVEAGYKCKTRKAALNMASENLEKPAIQAYIAELERRINKRHEQRVASIEDRRNLLTQFIYDQEIKATDRLKALDILNKMDAAYEQRIKMDTTINNPVQSLTTEELRKLIDNKPD